MEHHHAAHGNGAKPLVFVTVGTDHHRFERLMDWADAWGASHPDVRLVVQHGNARPVEHAESSPFLRPEQFKELLATANAVVCPGGPGGIMETRAAGLRPIVVPRRAHLEEHVDDHSTTYQTTATYRYDYPGQTHTGHRVAIDTGSDNIGDFQQQLYSELRTAYDRGAPVLAYVDPDEPANAVLNRELRAGLLALKGVFALVFGGVGFGLLVGARAGGKKLAAERALRDRFPDEPWRWRPEWANGRIAGSARSAAYVAIGFAVVWNLISLPLLFMLPGAIAGGNAAAAVGFLFPLIGVGLAIWARRLPA